jgi:crossover junction endodeoxyribonuclease RuvC
VRIFGIDPGSVRTGYGCLDTAGSRHRLVTCGAVATRPHAGLPDRLRAIHDTLADLLDAHRPDCVVVENLFHAKNVKSALVLGHARGVAVLTAVARGVPVVEYTPTEIKMAVVGYGRADKRQVQQMVQLLLRLDDAPTPHDASDALAVAICHAHLRGRVGRGAPAVARVPRHRRSWRDAPVPRPARRQTP